MEKIVFFVIIGTLVLPLTAAHLEGGQDKQIGEYIIDVGYEPALIKERQKANIVIALVNASTNESINPEKVWVRISDEKNVLFAGTVAQENGIVAFTYIFPKAGGYEMKMQFFRENSLLVETAVILEAQGSFAIDPILIAVMVIVATGAFIIGRKSLHKTEHI